MKRSEIIYELMRVTAATAATVETTTVISDDSSS